MNWEVFRKKRPWSTEGTIPVFWEGLRRTTKVFSLDIRCPGRDSNRAPPEYESRRLPLHQPARFKSFMAMRTTLTNVPNNGRTHRYMRKVREREREVGR